MVNMAQMDSAKPQMGTSRLSVDAASFVPGKLTSLSPGGDDEDSTTTSGPQKDESGLNELPHYVTNCYPFVKDDLPHHRSRGPNTWQGPGRPYSGHRMTNTHNGSHMYNGGRQAFSQGHHGNRHPRPQGFHQQRQQPSLLGFPPQVAPGYANPYISSIPAASQSLLPQFYQYQNNMMGVPPQSSPGWQGFQDFNSMQPFLSPGGGGGYYTAHGQYLTLSDKSESWSGSERGRSSSERGRSSDRGKNKSKKNKSEGSNMVSIGTQNDAGIVSNSPKKKSKTKTIILMDAANQTDFSDEIANLTLAERPHALFKKSKRPRRKSQAVIDDSSTDSEDEVDSDSGYSSPLHRRIQTSNATQHPASSLVTAETHSAVHQSGTNFYMTHPGLSHQNETIGGANSFAYPPLPTQNMVNGFPVQFNAVTPTGLPTTVGPLPPAFHNTGMSYAQVIGSMPVKTMQTNNANCVLMNNNNNVKQSGYQQQPGKIPGAVSSTTADANSGNPTGKKKRRSRRRKRNNQRSEDAGALSDEPLEMRKAHSSSNVSHTSTEQLNMVDDSLHFEDEEEFPDLLSASASQNQSSNAKSPVISSYSDILKAQPTNNIGQQIASPVSADSTGMQKESKSVRKRRKRREIIDKAADDELKEISLEQEVLKELSMKNVQVSQPQPAPPPPPPPAPSGGKKSKQPIALNIAAMIDALEKQQQQEEKSKCQKSDQNTPAWKKEPQVSHSASSNILDASAPLVKRGKERETPKQKKPSPLKKVILKEREEKKKFRLLDDPAADVDANMDDSSSATSSVPAVIPVVDSDLSQDGSKLSSIEMCTSASADFSPVSQTSPISMSPLSPGGSPLSSEVNSPIAGNGSLNSRSGVTFKIHSRRFREYCNQMLDKEIDNCCTMLLQELVRFQDRLYHKDPVKAKMKRRIVLGLREVTKHLKLKKIKMVIISPNLERIQSKGGLDEALNNIICMCTEQDVPFVFALGRRALGRACAKLVPVSVVGVFNYEGTEEFFNGLMELTEKARNAYKEMVQSLENEATEYSQRAPSSMSGGFPTLHAHLGHSRTPSACSAISFTSSILSEPISENYPQSEPETDSKGYEIVKSEEKKKDSSELVKSEGTAAFQSEYTKSRKHDDDNNNKGDMRIKSLVDNSRNDIDEGHEADTEDTAEVSPKTPSASVATGNKHQMQKQESQKSSEDDEGELADDDNDDDENEEEEEEEDSCGEDEDQIQEDSNDTVKDLPHIDSIHTSSLDLQVDILSQHSSTLNLEVMSTHSSKTLGDCSSTVNTEHTLIERHRHNSGKGAASDVTDNALDASGTKARPIDKDRIESWIAETQTHMDDLSLDDKDANSDSDEKGESLDSSSEEILKDTFLKSVSLEKLNVCDCESGEDCDQKKHKNSGKENSVDELNNN